MSDRRVLLVDADLKILRLVEATLALKNVETVSVESAAQALATLRAYAPDIVIADVALPDLSGLDLLLRARSLPGLVNLPFIFLTAKPDPALAERGASFGGTGFMRKPFAVDELLSRVLTVLGDTRSGRRDRAAAVGGRLASEALPDVLRMLVVQGRTGVLTMHPRGIGAEGLVFLREGRVIHAEFGLLTGIDALFAQLLHEDGVYAFTDGHPSVPPLIIESTLPLLMEGYRLIDEGLLRRIDPREASAARMFTHLVTSHRQPTPLAGEKTASLPTGRTERVDSLLEDFDDVGLNTEDFAPAFDTAELQLIEAELEQEFMDRTPGTIVIPALTEEESEEDPSEGITAVALVDDTVADMETVFGMDIAPRGAADDVMVFYEAVLAAARDELGAHSVQLGTRKGRVITSNIAEGTRRDTVAAFSREAIQFAASDEVGNQFASLDAGDLHVLVVEVDHVRLITLLFPHKPEPPAVLSILAPHLDDYRRAR